MGNCLPFAAGKLLPDECAGGDNPLLGVQQAVIAITVLPANIDPQHDYMLPFTMLSAGGNTIGSNFRNMIFTLKGQ